MKYKIHDKVKILTTNKTGIIQATYENNMYCVLVDDHYTHVKENEIDYDIQNS